MPTSVAVLLAFYVLLVVGTLYYELVHPHLTQRWQLKRLKAQGGYRVLSFDERKALSRYLTLTYDEYTLLLGGYSHRNDSWDGAWRLIDDQVYVLRTVFDVKLKKRFFKQYRFCKKGGLRFNILPYWEGLQRTPCEIEFVMTDKLPVVITINGCSLNDGMVVAEHFLNGHQAVEDFARYHNVGLSALHPEQGSNNEPQAAAEPIAQAMNEPFTKASDEPIEEVYRSADDDDERSNADPHLERTEPRATDTVDNPSVPQAEAQGLTTPDIRYHPATSSANDTAQSDDTDQGHDVDGFAIVDSRTLSRKEAMKLYARAYCRVIDVAIILLCIALAWSGASLQIEQNVITVLVVMALIGLIVGRISMPRWIPRPQIKTLQGPLVIGHFHPQRPTHRSLGIGNLGISELNADTFTEHDLGQVIDVDLTPQRRVIAVNGRSVLKDSSETPTALLIFTLLSVAALVVALYLNPAPLQPVQYLQGALHGPRHVTLSTLDEARRYQPQVNDVLDIKELPVVCGQGDSGATFGCGELTPGESIAYPIEDDDTRRQALKKLAQQFAHIDVQRSYTPVMPGYERYHGGSASSQLYFMVLDTNALVESLDFFRDRMAPEAYHEAILLLTDESYSKPRGQEHPAGIVLADENGRVLYKLLDGLLKHERDIDHQYIHSLRKKAPTRTASWTMSGASGVSEYSSSASFNARTLSPLRLTPSYEAPPRTGDTDWDTLMKQLASQQGGTLTISGQIESIWYDPNLNFRLQPRYHEVSLLARLLSISALLGLVGMLLKSALGRISKIHPPTTRRYQRNRRKRRYRRR